MGECWEIRRLRVGGYKVSRLIDGKETDKRFVCKDGWTKDQMIQWAKRDILNPPQTIDPLV